MEARLLANKAETAVRGVVSYDLLWNAMAVKIVLPRFSRRGGRVDDGEPSAGFQRTKRGSQHGIVFPHFVIGVYDQNRVQARRRESGIILRPQNSFNLRKALL